jgi:hypothetical protein
MAITDQSVPEGAFLARPNVWGLTETANGKEQFAIEFEITEPESDQAGKLITWFGGFEGDGFKWTTEAMRKCGWDGGDIRAVELSTEVRIVVRHEEYNGNWNAKVKFINGVDEQHGGSPGYLIEKQAMSDEKKAAFAREFAARMKASQGAQKPAAPAARPGVPARPGAPAARTAAPARPAAPASRPAAGAAGQRPGQRTAARPAAAQQQPVGNPDADDNGQQGDEDQIPY